MQLMSLLAHQPWLISKEHIAVLVKGADAWSISELIHALIIIVNFTSMCSIVFAAGILPEIDIPLPNDSGNIEITSDNNSKRFSGELDHYRIKELLKKKDFPIEPSGLSSEEKAQLFAIAAEEPAVSIPTISTVKGDEHYLKKYIGEFSIKHLDFDVRSKEYRPFRVQDYSWQEQGYSLVSRFYPKLAALLDEEFTHIYNLTYNTFSDEVNIDTTPFRSAIWHYVHRLKGLLHDDFNYRDVNVYLDKVMKTIIKKVICCPEVIVKEDLITITGFKEEEKIHMCLVALEAKKQAELIYGLHALMKHMT